MKTRFVQFKSDMGMIYINPDRVRYVLPLNDGKRTSIAFGGGDGVIVEEATDSVVSKLASAIC
jgi:hypothetical protein